MNGASTDLPLQENDDFYDYEIKTFKTGLKVKKNQKINTQNYKSGRWDINEHRLFMELFIKYKKNWKKVLRLIILD